MANVVWWRQCWYCTHKLAHCHYSVLTVRTPSQLWIPKGNSFLQSFSWKSPVKCTKKTTEMCKNYKFWTLCLCVCVCEGWWPEFWNKPEHCSAFIFINSHQPGNYFWAKGIFQSNFFLVKSHILLCLPLGSNSICQTPGTIHVCDLSVMIRMQTQYLWLQMFGLGMIPSPLKLRCNNKFITGKVLST
jgi:hypothetical protein